VPALERFTERPHADSTGDVSSLAESGATSQVHTAGGSLAGKDASLIASMAALRARCLENARASAGEEVKLFGITRA
jgi:hypothetical protein